MSSTAFAQTIISKLKGAIGTDGGGYGTATATTAMTTVAQAITEYLIANTSVIVTYSGMIPGITPTPDPTTVDEFSIVGSCAPTGPSDHFDDWISQIKANIISGFMLAPAGKAGVVFSMAPFLSGDIATEQKMLKAAHEGTDTDPQLKIWKIVCQGIMDWINGAAMNPTSGAATHPPAGSTGTAYITKITIT